MNIIPWTGCLLIAVLHRLPDYISCADLGSPCTVTADCSNVANATCSTTCKCDTHFKEVNQACVLNGINDTCTNDTNCLSANHLTCDTTSTHKCQCAQGYKPKAGACNPNAVNDTCQVAADCLSTNHLTCDTTSTHKCQCAQGYKPKAGACIPNAVNDTCKVAADCLSKNHLTCATTKCQCDTGYKPNAGVCIKNVIGKSCTDATVSTVCTLENSVCTSSVCACKPGFKNNADTCLKIIGGHCTGSSDCTGDTHSVCKSTVCECAEHFGEKDNVCTATLDSKQCTQPKGAECGANAECDEKTNTCRCSSGFKMNVDTCVAENGDLGSPCTVTADCSNVANATCSTTCKCDTPFKEVNQACVLNGINDSCTDNTNCLSANYLTCDTTDTHKCQCAQGYKPKAGACIPKVIGKQCTDATVSTVCTLENSVCTSSLCACKPGFNNNADTCLKIIGGHCTGNVACTGDTHSVCKNNLCECADHFGEKDNVCTATLDSKQCTPPKGTECGANAECDEKTKTCRCSSGFKMNVDTCVADNGGMTTSLTFAILAIPGLLALREAYGQFGKSVKNLLLSKRYMECLTHLLPN